MGGFLSFIKGTASFAVGGYEISVNLGIITKRPGVTNFCKNLESALKLVEILQTNLNKLKHANEDLSQSTQVSLEYLEYILKQTESDSQRKPREVEKMRTIYSDLQEAFLKLVDESDANKLRSIGGALKSVPLRFKRWYKAAQLRDDLREIQEKIKNAVQMSIELTIMSTSVAVNKLHILQQYNASGTWLVTDESIDRPDAPRLSLEIKPKKFLLTWQEDHSDDTGVDYFELCYDRDRSLYMSLLGKIHEIEIGPPRVVAGNIYSMKIRGINAGGAGRWSNTVVAQFTNPPPSKPERPAIQMVSLTTAVLTVVPPKKSHETESPVKGWNVQYMTRSDKEWMYKHFTVKPKTKNSLTVDDLDPKQEYQFRVQAINADGGSDFSEPISFKTVYEAKKAVAKRKPGYEPSPPEIKEISASRAKITLTSQKRDSPLKEWRVQYILEPPKEWTTITKKAKPGAKPQSFFIENLIPDQAYSVQVQAIHTEGDSGLSQPVSFKTIPRAMKDIGTQADNNPLTFIMGILAIIMIVLLAFYFR